MNELQKKPEQHSKWIERWNGLSPSQRQRIKHGGMIFALLLATVAVFAYGRAKTRAAYDNAKTDIYNYMYETAYSIAEERNHVTNRVDISLGNLQEMSKLEVLSVQDSTYSISDESKVVSWLKFEGTGTFTVDLSIAEFITDSDRQYILVRIPKPMLTNFKKEETVTSFWHDGRFFQNGSVLEGVQLAQSQIRDGASKLQEEMRQSRFFYEQAKKSAESMLKSLLKGWNPEIPDLQVDVEFF